MTEINWGGLAQVGVIIIICLIALAVLSGFASAADTGLPNESYIIVDVPTPDPTQTYNDNSTFFAVSGLNSTTVINVTKPEPAYNNTRLLQGQCVEVGGIYDVSSVIGYTFTTEYNEFAYFGRYEDSFDPSYQNETDYIYKIPYQRKAYYNFYLDPTIFGDRLGYWYQYTGKYEPNANKRAFYVSDKCIKDVNASVFVDMNNTPILINPYVMETHPSGADILLSRDDPLIMGGLQNETRAWMFGNTVKILGEDITNTSVLNSSMTQTLSHGSYTLLLQTPGSNKIYDVVYYQNNRTVTDGKDLLIPSLRSIPIADVTGFAPVVIQRSLMNIFDTGQLDDGYVNYSVLVEPPVVQISGYQELVIGNQSLLEVTGYTNKIPGTPIMLYVDRNEQTGRSDKYPSMTIITENASLGDYRTFHGYIPLYYENMAKGFHNLTAVLPSGAKAGVDFYIREEPAAYYQEPVFHKFIDGNPFIPTPTPIIIEKEVVREIVKTEYKTIIEKEPVDYATLSWTVIFNLVLPAVLIVIPGLYIVFVLGRAVAERRMRSLMEKKKL